MSLASNDRKITYIGNDVTATFSFDFKITDEDNIKVLVVDASGAETLLTIATDYTVSGVGNGSGGTVTLVDSNQAWLDTTSNGLDSAYSILLIGNTPTTQETDIRNQGTYYASLHEDALDKVTMISQELVEKIRRAMLFPASSSNLDKVMPNPTLNNILIWDGSGNLVNLPLSSIASGTYTGAALSLPLQSHTTGTLNIPSNATYSSIYVTGAAGKTINLPTAAAAGAGRMFTIMSDTFTGSTTVNRTGSDTLEGVTSFSYLSAYKNMTFISDGVATWHHNLPKASEIVSAMIGNREVGPSKWILTNTSTQTTGFTANVVIGYYPCNTTAGSFTATLPATNINGGKIFTFENIGTANVLTIDGNSSEQIDGTLTKPLLPGEAMTIVSDATGWRIISMKLRGLTTATSGIKTPAATNNWHTLTTNSVVLTQGRWRLSGVAHFNNGGVTPTYTTVAAGFYSANGADSAVEPAALSGVSGVTILSVQPAGTSHLQPSTGGEFRLPLAEVILDVTTATSGSIFLVTYATMTTAANARVTGYINATKIGV